MGEANTVSGKEQGPLSLVQLFDQAADLLLQSIPEEGTRLNSAGSKPRRDDGFQSEKLARPAGYRSKPARDVREREVTAFSRW